MNGPWRNGKPLPEAVAPPIFPEHEPPKLAPVISPYLKDYEAPAHTPKEVSDLAEVIVKKYRNPRTMSPPYPIGTLIPVTVGGQDFLAVFQWHHNLDPAGHPAVEMWVPKKGRHVDVILLGRWLVTFDTGWSWFYTFYGTKAAFCTDIKNPPEVTAHGTWSVDGTSVKIRWMSSSEEWSLPLDPTGVRGQSLVGQGGLSAEKVS